MNERTDNRQLWEGTEKEWLLESILNDSNQMVQVSDLETYTMLYANRAARIYTGHENQPYQGEYCYKYMMGREEPCPFCPMRKMEQDTCQETEVDNGKEVFAVKTRVTEWNGKKVFIEYGRNITEEKKERLAYEKQMREQFDVVNALSRDYLNIFLVDGDTDTAKILKLDGYVTTGLVNNPDIIYPYQTTCEQYISERVHPDDQKMMHEMMKLERVLQELTGKKEYVSSYKTLVDGKVHYYQFKYMRLENTKHIIAGFQNIDALITREKEVQKKLELALKAEEQSNQAKRVFMNSMSHDIRTPLNAIVGYTTLALSHIEEKDAVKKYLSRITTAGSHLIALVNDVLEMNQIESGNIQMDDLPVYVPDVIEELETIIQASVSEKNLNFIVDAEEIIHKKILTDKLRLNQVLLNILGNSVKFTKPGDSISFKVKEIGNAPEGYASYCFEIKDTGIGMSQEFRKHIFETFTREKTATVSGIPGSGLGMAIAKNIVDLLGGTIQVKSEVDKGTETTVYLQFKLCDAVEENKEDDESIPDFRGKKILLVEDNELNREIAVEILQEAGFSIETAGDGMAAVEKMRHAAAGTYDLVLMDVQMPKMDGYEATREIRKLSDPEKASIPIIAMTANAFAEDRQKAFESGMDGYIAKPIDISKMLETLKGFLKEKA